MAIRLKAEIPLVSDDRNLLNNQQSLIQQNADNILLKVAQSDYNGVNIVSLINLAPDTVKIQAKNIDISGLVTISSLSTAGQTTINGSNITTGTISADRINFDNAVGNNVNLTGKITANSGKIARFDINSDDLVYTSDLFNYVYDRSDVNKLHRLLLELEPATAYDLAIYDMDNSGSFSILDLVLVDRQAQGINPPQTTKKIRSVVRIGTNNGALITQAVAENGAVGPSTTLRGEKITSDLVNAKAISTTSISMTSIVIGGNTYSVTRDSNGFLKAT